MMLVAQNGPNKSMSIFGAGGTGTGEDQLGGRLSGGQAKIIIK